MYGGVRQVPPCGTRLQFLSPRACEFIYLRCPDISRSFVMIGCEISAVVGYGDGNPFEGCRFLFVW